MSDSEEDDRTVCFCHNVQLKELLQAIRDGAVTLHDVQAITRASTGCGGCEWDVIDILESELAAQAQLNAQKKSGS